MTRHANRGLSVFREFVDIDGLSFAAQSLNCQSGQSLSDLNKHILSKDTCVKPLKMPVPVAAE